MYEADYYNRPAYRRVGGKETRNAWAHCAYSTGRHYTWAV